MNRHDTVDVFLLKPHSCAQHADTSCLLDLCLRLLGEVPRLDDDWLAGKDTLASDLHVPSFEHIDDWCLVLVVGIVRARLLRDKRPQPLDVDDGADFAVLDEVEISHANLAKITRVVLVEVDAVVVLTTGVTATTRVFAVLANATATGRDMATQVTVLLEARGHGVALLWCL